MHTLGVGKVHFANIFGSTRSRLHGVCVGRRSAASSECINCVMGWISEEMYARSSAVDPPSMRSVDAKKLKLQT